VAKDHADTGLIYCNTVFSSDLPYDRAAVKCVRVIEGILMGQSISANASFARRILGTVPIHPDGSFYVKCLRTRPSASSCSPRTGRCWFTRTEFNYVRGGETKGCVGCHEPRKQASGNLRPAAMNEPPVKTLRQRGDLIYFGKPDRSYNALYRE